MRVSVGFCVCFMLVILVGMGLYKLINYIEELDQEEW